MKALSSNSTRSNSRAFEKPYPPVELEHDFPPGMTSGTRRQRFLSCLIDHPALPLVVQLTLTVSTWFPDETGGLYGWATNWQKQFVAAILSYLPEGVLNESYRRMVRRALIDRLRRQ